MLENHLILYQKGFFLFFLQLHLIHFAKYSDIFDIQELFKETIAEFMEGSLESELDEELGYEPYDVKNKTTDNSRNGHSKKVAQNQHG